MSETTSLVLLGRKFEGFERALTAQLRELPEVDARFELVEIGDLQQEILDGKGTSSGAYDVLMLITDWLPSLTLRNLRAGRGAMELHLERDRVQVVGNTTGFKVVHGRLPRPALVEAPLARA